MSKHKAGYYTRTFKEILQNHPPVFSHGDFQLKNVMIRISSNPSMDQENTQENTDKASPELDVVIIDWEFAGWYPSYWEYARTIFACGGWEDDWSVWVDGILETFRNEYVWTNMFLSELWS